MVLDIVIRHRDAAVPDLPLRHGHPVVVHLLLGELVVLVESLQFLLFAFLAKKPQYLSDVIIVALQNLTMQCSGFCVFGALQVNGTIESKEGNDIL